MPSLDHRCKVSASCRKCGEIYTPPLELQNVADAAEDPCHECLDSEFFLQTMVQMKKSDKERFEGEEYRVVMALVRWYLGK